MSIAAADRPRPGDRPLPTGLAVPGLVDLHGHVGLGPFAVRPDVPAAGGVATLCSQGDAGPASLGPWLRSTAGARGRLLLALDLAPEGEAGAPAALARVGPTPTSCGCWR